MSLTIVFLRHGQSTHSRDDRYCGARTDAPLTDDGREMARCFAEAYKKHQWTAIYSSPQVRARDTAAPIAGLTGKQVQVRDGLKEIDYGDWEGLLPAEIRERYQKEHDHWLEDPGKYPPPGGETAYDVEKRVRAVIEEVRSAHVGGEVLLVAHKTTIRVAICSLLGVPVKEHRRRIGMPICSVSEIKFSGDVPMLVRHGDQHHLPEKLLKLPGS